MTSSLERFIAAVASLYATGPAMLTEVGKLLPTLPVGDAPLGTGARLPVTHFIGPALAAARSSPMADVANTFAEIEPDADWVRNPNYAQDPPDPEFLDNYGYVEVIGPGRRIDTALCRVGFLLLGPRTHYPMHEHPAEEVYHVVSGDALWLRADRPWAVEPPGTLIHHPSWMRHATHAQTQPMLALYGWAGEIATHAVLAKN
jgi:mannose-6-phosphate isomerase-like protein (cupin superfamily)